MQEGDAIEAGVPLNIELTPQDHEDALLIFERALRDRITKFRDRLKPQGTTADRDDPYGEGKVEYPRYKLEEAARLRNTMKQARDEMAEKLQRSGQILRIQRLQLELHNLNVTWWEGIVQQAVDDHV